MYKNELADKLIRCEFDLTQIIFSRFNFDGDIFFSYSFLSE